MFKKFIETATAYVTLVDKLVSAVADLFRTLATLVRRFGGLVVAVVLVHGQVRYGIGWPLF